MDHLNILGRSIADPLVTAYLDAQERLDPVDFRQNAEWGVYGRPDSGFSLSAEPLSAYYEMFEQVKSRGLPDDKEMIVGRLDFNGTDALNAKQRPYLQALPFGLQFGDSADDVANKLGTTPHQQHKSSTLPEYSAVRFVYSYIVGSLQVIAKYDAHHQLMIVYLLPISKATRQSIHRRDTLHQQIILPANIDKIEALRRKMPTRRWRAYIAEVDGLFNEADIAQAERLFNAFIDEVKEATVNADASAVYAATKTLVFALNELNEKSGLIESLESEEIYIFIDKVVRATGFSLEEDEDISSEWREW